MKPDREPFDLERAPPATLLQGAAVMLMFAIIIAGLIVEITRVPT